MTRTMGIIIVAVALLAACATAPEAVPPPDEAYDTAKSLRAQIQRFDLAQYAQSEFEAGEEHFITAEQAYEGEDYATAETGFDLAIDRYMIVIDEGFQALVARARESATTQRARAEEVKADVAVATAYAEALSVYNEALEAQEAGDNELAQELFSNAATLFEQAYEQAAEKQRQALDALDRVDERIEGLERRRGELEEGVRGEFEDDGEAAEEEAN